MLSILYLLLFHFPLLFLIGTILIGCDRCKTRITKFLFFPLFFPLRATTVIGYLPQEVLGTSCYEYFHQDDLQHLAGKHRQGNGAKPQLVPNWIYAKITVAQFVFRSEGMEKESARSDLFRFALWWHVSNLLAVLRSKEKIETQCYKFKTKYGSYVSLQSQWFSFTNPWTKEVEFIVSLNRVIS